MKLKNRHEAGLMLAKLLENYRDSDALVLAIPRGGVIVGATIAQELNLDIDLIITKKIIHPRDLDRTIGAVAQDGNPVFESRNTTDIEFEWLNKQVREAREEITHRHLVYSKDDQPLEIEGKVVLLVTDGVLTGLTALAAIEELYRLRASRIVLIVPAISIDAATDLKPMVHKLVVINVEENVAASVDEYYEEETEITDEDVIAELKGFH